MIQTLGQTDLVPPLIPWMEEQAEETIRKPLTYAPPLTLTEQIEQWMLAHKTAVYLSAAGLLALALLAPTGRR